MASAPHLTKSRFVAGDQCPKLLWWRVNEPDAEELEPDVVLQDLFDQGRLVGERAREEFPGGVLIGGADGDESRVQRTQDAIEAGAAVIFEGAFEQDGVFCAIDVLEKNADGWTLIEVKSASEVKDYHLPDVAVQVHVARRAGLNVTRAEVMHLNKEYRLPAGGALFVRANVTEDIAPFLADIAVKIADQLDVLRGGLPEYPVGLHCWAHNECAFFKRCWPPDPDHISNLWNVGPKKTWAYMQTGVNRMSDLPADAKLNPKQQRQMRAQREHRLIVEPGLVEAMRPAMEAKRLGFLDFETVGRAIPTWNALGPWHQAAAQFSYHERVLGETDVTHREFLAEGPVDPAMAPDDPREAIAVAMLEATKDADLVVVYTAFEKTRIKELAAYLPHLAAPLEELKAKLWDLNPVVTNNVYDPAFRGSFSLKTVITPLVPDVTYHDGTLEITDGMTASVEIARLLFVSGRIPLAHREKTRRDLLAYCKMDTYATVRLVERLGALAAG